MKTKRTAAAPTARPHIARRNGETPEHRKPALTPTQQLVCDEVAHLLFVGGDEREIESLLRAVLGSAERRCSTDSARGSALSESDVAGHIQRNLAGHKAALLAGWRRYDDEPAEMPEPKTATERIRDNVMQHLRYEFDEFMLRAKPEEHMLLLNMLMVHMNVNRGRTSPDHDLPLVIGMTEAMGKPRGCVMVEEDQLKTVEKYVQALEAIQAA